MENTQEINQKIINMYRNGSPIGFIVYQINKPERGIQYDYVEKILRDNQEEIKKQRECEVQYYDDINTESQKVFCAWLKFKHYEKMMNRIEDALDEKIERTNVPINKFCDISDRMFEARKDYIEAWKESKTKINDKYEKSGIELFYQKFTQLTNRVLYQKQAQLENHDSTNS
jgi:hypothetical protein